MAVHKAAYTDPKTGEVKESRVWWYDLRHSFRTNLGEAGVPERTMLDMMGHVSEAMLRRYSHIRVRARQEAVAAVEERQNPESHVKESSKVTNSDASKKLVTH